MKKHLAIVAAAALTVGGFTYAQDAQPNQPNAAERAGSAIEHGAEKTGSAIKHGAEKVGDALTGNHEAQTAAGQTKSSEEIHDVMAQVAEAALTKDGLDNIVERFVDADRNRLGTNKDDLKADDTLNGRIAQFQKDWKAKYNQDFDIKDEDAVYNASFAMITEGEEGKARTASDRIGADATAGSGAAAASGAAGGVSASGSVNTNTGTATGNVDNKSGVDAPKANTDGQTAADTNRNDPGRNIATVHIAASHNMPALDVPMIHEAGGWKIDVPDSVDGPKFKQAVLTALTHCDEMKDQWPADVNDAYRAVTHSVLLSIFDKPLDDKSAGGATGASGTDTNANIAAPSK